MDGSRKQFEEWFKPKKMAMMSKSIRTLSIRKVHSLQWEAWKASRQDNPVVAYLTHQGSAVSPDDFEGGESEMHKTAKREEWVPLVKKGE